MSAPTLPETPDDATIETMAKAIHDSPDMADTTWPDDDDDTGYRGGAGYARLCLDPETFRAAARAAYAALRAELMRREGC